MFVFLSARLFGLATENTYRVAIGGTIASVTLVHDDGGWKYERQMAFFH